jgi:hypothetical protein
LGLLFDFLNFFWEPCLHTRTGSWNFWEPCFWTLRIVMITTPDLAMFLRIAQHWNRPLCPVRWLLGNLSKQKFLNMWNDLYPGH